MKRATLLASVLLLTSCTTYYHYTNQTSSPILSQGRVVGQMNIDFASGYGINGTSMTATTSDGEVFTGNVVINKVDVIHPQNVTFDPTKIIGNNGKLRGNLGLDYDPGGVETVNTRNWTAILNGSHGHITNCQFTTQHPKVLLIDGGSMGNCAISDGRYFAVTLVNNSLKTETTVSDF